MEIFDRADLWQSTGISQSRFIKSPSVNAQSSWSSVKISANPVRDYSEWQKSFVQEEPAKAQVDKACEVVLTKGLGLNQLHGDYNFHLLVEEVVNEGGGLEFSHSETFSISTIRHAPSFSRCAAGSMRALYFKSLSQRRPCRQWSSAIHAIHFLDSCFPFKNDITHPHIETWHSSES